MHSIVNWLWVFGVAALLFAWYKTMYVNRQDTGTERMAEISSYIREGAIAFLKREYTVLAVFAIVLLATAAFAGPQAVQAQRTQKPALHAKHWMAITGKPLGATAGAMIFTQGGNAIDAAADGDV